MVLIRPTALVFLKTFHLSSKKLNHFGLTELVALNSTLRILGSTHALRVTDKASGEKACQLKADPL